MATPGCARSRLLISLLILACLPGIALAQAPDEVQGGAFSGPATLVWAPAAGADFYNVYRGTRTEILAGAPPRCHGHPVGSTSFDVTGEPAPGEALLFQITAESSLDGEGTAGNDSFGPRPLLGSCTTVIRNHVLSRAGYGPDEWTRARLAALGVVGYIAEQLDPSSISELDNTDLKNAMTGIESPKNITELVSQQIVRGTYARRQLEQQFATFWANHFNTDYQKTGQFWTSVFPQCGDPPTPQCDMNYPQRAELETTQGQLLEIEGFRDLGFNGTFREMVELSAKSPAMIIYLDTFYNNAGAANENYARELMELHTMGVDGGYTQQDVEQLARVFTGWKLCKKAHADIDDPLAPCLSDYWEPLPPGRIVATYDVAQHDCGEKVLFGGTPHEATIPDTCATPNNGVNDLGLAIDAILAHPATKHFISKKILERFVTEQPTEAMIDVLEAEWDNATNPQGVGDMREVLRAALTLPEFLDPDRVRTKIKTPLEHFVSALRAIRGLTQGTDGTVISYLVSAQHIPHYNPVPTGWPEDGGSWIDTTNTLTRQNFGLHVSAIHPGAGTFGSYPIELLNDHGVSTAPGNAEEIVDFMIDVIFGGALSPAERQAAIDYLNTDSFGVPAPYDDARIRQTIGVMLGYAQFQEQ